MLHCIPEVHAAPPSGSLYYHNYDAEAEQLWEKAESFIRREFVAVARDRGIDCQVVLMKMTDEGRRRHKHVGMAVCEKAEELNAEPLVLFAHHRSKLEEWLLGSVSKFCAANCKRPVVLVHPEHTQLGSGQDY